MVYSATAAKVPNGPSRWTKEDLVRERADSSEHRKMLSAELVKARQSAGVMGGVMGGRQEGRQDKVAVARTSDEGKETRPPAAEPGRAC